MTYSIVLEPVAMKMLAGITDRRVREKIRDRIDALAREPDKQGKPLTGELAGYRSIPVAGQRYRIIYQVKTDKVIIVVVALGIRKEKSRQDIYHLAKRILRLRLWEPAN